MTTRIKLRRDTAANWNTANPVLALGEAGYDTTNNKIKVGDGTTAWQDLEYLAGSGGGNANTGNYTFTDDTIANANGMFLETDRGTLTLGADIEAPGDSTHFHIAFENSNTVEPSAHLYLGDDYNYFKVESGRNGVKIGSSDGGNPTRVWNFNTDGSLMIPQGGDIVNSLGDSVIGNASGELTGIKLTATIPTTGGILGQAVTFERPANSPNTVDTVDAGLILKRPNSGGGWYNSYQNVETSYNSNISPLGTLWNSDGWGDLADVQTRNYVTFYEACDYNVGENVVGYEFVMWDTANDKYYKFDFEYWQPNGGGGANQVVDEKSGLKYTRTLINLDNVTYFVRGPNDTNLGDAVDAGLTIKRGSAGGLYNSEVDNEWDPDNTPTGTLWNAEHQWRDFSDITTLTWKPLYAAVHGHLGNNLVGKKLLMWDTINNKYYTVKFTNWGVNNGGSFAYVRRQIDPTGGVYNGITFADGSFQDTATTLGDLKVTNNTIKNIAQPGYGIELTADVPNNYNFGTSYWTTASWTTSGSNGVVSLTYNVENGNHTYLSNFLSDLGRYATKQVSINGGPRLEITGYGSNNFYTITPPDTDPTTVTQVEFYLEFHQRMYFGGENTNGFFLNDQSDTFEVTARDINLYAGDDTRIRANDYFELRNYANNSGIRIITNADEDNREWEFTHDGSLKSPSFTTNSFDGSDSMSGPTLRLGNLGDNTIITDVPYTTDIRGNYNLRIQGQRGYGTWGNNDTNAGNGSSIQIYAGAGGESDSADLGGEGGNLDIRAGFGQAGRDGGDINIQAGDSRWHSGTNSVTGGHLTISAGNATSGMGVAANKGQGGDVQIAAGMGNNNNGEITLRTSSNGTDLNNTWEFKNDGSLLLPKNGLLFPNGGYLQQRNEEGVILWVSDAGDPTPDELDNEYVGLWYGGEGDSPNVSITAGTYTWATDDESLEYVYYTNTDADVGTRQINLDIRTESGNILNWHMDTSGNLYLPAHPEVSSSSGIVFGDGTVQKTAVTNTNNIASDWNDGINDNTWRIVDVGGTKEFDFITEGWTEIVMTAPDTGNFNSLGFSINDYPQLADFNWNVNQANSYSLYLGEDLNTQLTSASFTQDGTIWTFSFDPASISAGDKIVLKYWTEGTTFTTSYYDTYDQIYADTTALSTNSFTINVSESVPWAPWSDFIANSTVTTKSSITFKSWQNQIVRDVVSVSDLGDGYISVTFDGTPIDVKAITLETIANVRVTNSANNDSNVMTLSNDAYPDFGKFVQIPYQNTSTYLYTGGVNRSGYLTIDGGSPIDFYYYGNKDSNTGDWQIQFDSNQTWSPASNVEIHWYRSECEIEISFYNPSSGNWNNGYKWLDWSADLPFYSANPANGIVAGEGMVTIKTYDFDAKDSIAGTTKFFWSGIGNNTPYPYDPYFGDNVYNLYWNNTQPFNDFDENGIVYYSNRNLTGSYSTRLRVRAIYKFTLSINEDYYEWWD